MLGGGTAPHQDGAREIAGLCRRTALARAAGAPPPVPGADGVCWRALALQQHRMGLGCGWSHLPDAGVAADSATPARSALIMRARAFSAAFESVTPLLRSARRDTGLPTAASLLVTIRACSIFPCAGRVPKQSAVSGSSVGGGNSRAPSGWPGARRSHQATVRKMAPAALERGGPGRPAVYEAAELCISAVMTVPASILW